MAQVEQQDPKHSQTLYIRLLGLTSVLIAGFLIFKWLPPELIPTNAKELSELLNSTSQSLWAPLIFVGFYTCAITLGVPGTAITIAGGVIFGALWGTILSTLGANAGANLSFFISRYLGRTTLEKYIKYDFNFYRRDAHPRDFWTLLSLRLFPLVPFTGLNFVCGFTNLPWRAYSLATFIGMLPWTILYSTFADTALAVSQAFSWRILSKLLLLSLLILGFLGLRRFFNKQLK